MNHKFENVLVSEFKCAKEQKHRLFLDHAKLHADAQMCHDRNLDQTFAHYNLRELELHTLNFSKSPITR